MIALILPLLMILGPGPADVGASLIALLFLVHVVVDRDRVALQAWWFRLALVLWVFMLATAPFALASVSEAFGRAATFLRFPMLAAALGFWLLTEPKWRDRYMAVLLAIVLFSAVWALVEKDGDAGVAEWSIPANPSTTPPTVRTSIPEKLSPQRIIFPL